MNKDIEPEEAELSPSFDEAAQKTGKIIHGTGKTFLELCEVERPWLLLPKKGDINPKTGGPYKSTQMARWHWLEAQNDPLLIILRSIIMREVMNSPEVRERIAHGVRLANERPEVIERRLAALDRLKALPRELTPKQREKARLHALSRGLVKLDDLGVKIYVMRRKDQPDGPHKIGSSKDPSVRREQLERDGYLPCWEKKDKLEVIRVYDPRAAKYGRRVEMKAHELMEMDAEHKNKFGEMCFSPLLAIDKMIQAAIQIVADEVAEEEELARIAAQERAVHAVRRIPLFSDFGEFVSLSSQSPDEFREKLATATFADDMAWDIAEMMFGENTGNLTNLSKEAQDYQRTLSAAMRAAFNSRPDLFPLNHGSWQITRAFMRKCARKREAIIRNIVRQHRTILPKQFRKRVDQYCERSKESRHHHQIGEASYKLWMEGAFVPVRGKLDEQTKLPDWAIWHGATRVEFTWDEWTSAGGSRIISGRVRYGMRTHINIQKDREGSGLYIGMSVGRLDQAFGFIHSDWQRVFHFKDGDVDEFNEHYEPAFKAWARDASVSLQCGRVMPQMPPSLSALEDKGEDAGPPYVTLMNVNNDMKMIIPLLGSTFGGRIHSRDCGKHGTLLPGFLLGTMNDEIKDRLKLAEEDGTKPSMRALQDVMGEAMPAGVKRVLDEFERDDRIDIKPKVIAMLRETLAKGRQQAEEQPDMKKAAMAELHRQLLADTPIPRAASADELAALAAQRRKRKVIEEMREKEGLD